MFISDGLKELSLVGHCVAHIWYKKMNLSGEPVRHYPELRGDRNENKLNPLADKPWVRIHQPFSRTFFVFFLQDLQIP